MPVIFTFAGQSIILDFLMVFLAQYLAYIFAIFFFVFVVDRRNRYTTFANLLYAGLAAIVSFGIVERAITYFWFRPRPYVQFNFEPILLYAPTASFPSTHALIAFTLASVVFFLGKKRESAWLFGMAALIGLGRVFAGLHFPIDILAGAVLGFLVAFLVRVLLRRYLPAQRPSVDVMYTEPEAL